MKRATWVATVLALWGGGSTAQEAGSLRLQREAPFDELFLPTGPAAGREMPVLRFEGVLREEAWLYEARPSTLALLAEYKAQAEAQGYDILFECRDMACGGYDFRRNFAVLPAPQMHIDFADFRFFAAQNGQNAQAVLVSRSTGASHVQITSITPTAQRPVAVARVPFEGAPDGASSLWMQLEAEGRVVLEGLSFLSGAAQVTGESATLLALAEALRADPARKVLIVGHSDVSGSYEANVTLSKARAQSVLARLEALGVARAQMQAQGAAYVAPLGRDPARNRRVEAVILP